MSTPAEGSWRDLAGVPEELRALRAEVGALRQMLRAQIAVPVSYTAKELVTMGYGERRAYEILRSHGVRRGHRLHITAEALRRYQEGES